MCSMHTFGFICKSDEPRSEEIRTLASASSPGRAERFRRDEKERGKVRRNSDFGERTQPRKSRAIPRNEKERGKVRRNSEFGERTQPRKSRAILRDEKEKRRYVYEVDMYWGGT